MANPTINVQQFQNAVGNNPQLMAMIPVFNESPNLVNLINTYTSNSTLTTGNQIVFGTSNQDPVNATNRLSVESADPACKGKLARKIRAAT